MSEPSAGKLLKGAISKTELDGNLGLEYIQDIQESIEFPMLFKKLTR